MLVALVSEIFVESVQHAATTLGMSPAFVGFIIVALVGAAAEMAVAFSAARKNRLDMSVSIALGSASQIALFVAPVLVLLSYVVGPKPMDLQFWPGAVTMVMISTVTATFVTNSGRSAWFIGALLIFIYATFAMTLYGSAGLARSGGFAVAPEQRRNGRDMDIPGSTAARLDFWSLFRVRRIARGRKRLRRSAMNPRRNAIAPDTIVWLDFRSGRYYPERSEALRVGIYR